MKTSFQTFDNEFQTRKENQQLSYRHVNGNQSETNMMLSEFQTLKQINRILDSDPQSVDGKEQKIRSLIVMLKKQLDINKKLETSLSDSNKKVQGLQKQLSFRTTQTKNYEKTILELKEKIINLENQNKNQKKKLSQSKEQIKYKDELIQKMRQSYTNQKYSMQNELQYLKQKNLDYFKQKLNYSTKILEQTENNRPITSSKAKSCSKRSKDNKSDKKQMKQNIIRRNILSISQKENELKSGQNLLKKFEQTKLLNERIKQIQKGNYDSVGILRK